MTRSNRLAGAAFALGSVAIVLSLASLLRPQPRDVYPEIVDELAETLRPVYIEFGLREPLDDPTTIHDALAPLFEMLTTLEAGGVGSDTP